MRLDRLENGFICYRCLCTPSSSNQSNSTPGGSSAGTNSGSGGSSTGTNSGNSESSGGSQKTEQGKSSRGSVSFSPYSQKYTFLLVHLRKSRYNLSLLLTNKTQIHNLSK